MLLWLGCFQLFAYKYYMLIWPGYTQGKLQQSSFIRTRQTVRSVVISRSVCQIFLIDICLREGFFFKKNNLFLAEFSSDTMLELASRSEIVILWISVRLLVVLKHVKLTWDLVTQRWELEYIKVATRRLLNVLFSFLEGASIHQRSICSWKPHCRCNLVPLRQIIPAPAHYAYHALHIEHNDISCDKHTLLLWKREVRDYSAEACWWQLRVST